MEEKSYVVKDAQGFAQFVKESELSEVHVQYFIAQLIGTSQSINQTALIFFENILLKANNLEGIAGADPDLSQVIKSEREQITLDLKKIVDLFNSTPLIARDIYTRAFLSAMGIHFNPADNPTQQSGRIIQLPE